MLVQTGAGAQMDRPVSISDELPRYLERLSRPRERKKPDKSATAGYSDLNRFAGGLNPGELIVITGRPSTGKTTLALNIALSAAVNRMRPTAIFSPNLSCEQIVLRLVAGMGRFDPSEVLKRRLTVTDWERIDMAAGILSRAPIFMDDTANLSTAELRRRVLDLKKNNGLGLVIVDELQGLYPSKRDDIGVASARSIPQALKGMARVFDVAVLAVSRLSRRAQRRRSNRMVLSDLWGSGVEHDADLIVSLFKREFYVWGRLGSLKHYETPSRK